MGHILFRGILFACMMVATAAIGSDVVSSRRELAPTGRLRVGVVSAPKANVFFVVTDADADPMASRPTLATNLRGPLEVASEYFVAHNSGEITDALENGLIDVAFLPVDDERRKRVEFGPAYNLFESTCLVLGSSGFRTVSDLDRPGVRVGGEANTTTIRAAARELNPLLSLLCLQSPRQSTCCEAAVLTRLRSGAMRSCPIRRRFRVRASLKAIAQQRNRDRGAEAAARCPGVCERLLQ